MHRLALRTEKASTTHHLAIYVAAQQLTLGVTDGATCGVCVIDPQRPVGCLESTPWNRRLYLAGCGRECYRQCVLGLLAACVYSLDIAHNVMQEPVLPISNAAALGCYHSAHLQPTHNSARVPPWVVHSTPNLEKQHWEPDHSLLQCLRSRLQEPKLKHIWHQKGSALATCFDAGLQNI